jgi:hypothetical protein
MACAGKRSSITKTTHNMSHTKIYRIWVEMIARCTNPNNNNNENYMGRGITVCERWLESFENFYEDMGDSPPKHDLDRKDNDLGYSKENCRWANRSISQRNQRKRKGSKNPYKGVSITKSGKYQVKVSLNYKQTYLGSYDTAEEARDVYQNYIISNGLI